MNMTRFAVTAGMFLCLAIDAFAQANINGALKGTATDSSGALVTGASVVLKSADTGRESTAVTDESGNFAFPLVTPGNYSLTVEKPVFF